MQQPSLVRRKSGDRPDIFLTQQCREFRIQQQQAHYLPFKPDDRWTGKTRSRPLFGLAGWPDHSGRQKRLQITFRHLRNLLQPFQDLHAQGRRRHCGTPGSGLVQGPRATFHRIHIITGDNFLYQELRQRHCLFHLFLEGLMSIFPDITVRIVFRRQKQKSHAFRIRYQRQTGFQRTSCRTAARVVAIERKDDPVGMTHQFVNLHRCTGCPQRRHHLRKTRLRQCNDIHIAFHDQHIPRVPYRLTCLEQAV